MASAVYADSPGDTVSVTQLDIQIQCTSGSRMAVDTNGGSHFTWMEYVGPQARGIYYAYIDPSGNMPEPPQAVGSGGFSQIAVNSAGQPGIVFHALAESLFYYAGDVMHLVPYRGLWPTLSYDRSNRVHVVFGRISPQANHIIRYTRSDDGGVNWSALVDVDTSEVPSYLVTSSPVSDKVAIVYANAFDSVNQWSNDIFYIQSLDGVTWDFANGKVNVTGYGNDTDSIAAYADLDAVYDYNDNLHMVWHTVTMQGTGITNRNSIFHADQVSESIVEIVRSDDNWANCDAGAWNLYLSKMSLSVHPSNALVITYTRFSPNDCSSGGYANGDIFMQHSPDGILWSEPSNITYSPSPNCLAGDCDSDHWPSAAERIDDFLHLFYINDKDAGGYVQGEGEVTLNPLLYLRFPYDQLDTGEPIQIPVNFALLQNYPNPFNAQTTISFDLTQAGRARLEVFDITGARAAVLIDRRLESGRYNITWRADNLASGIYYYRLETDNGALTNRMILLK
jgi:hypothetical protein